MVYIRMCLCVCMCLCACVRVHPCLRTFSFFRGSCSTTAVIFVWLQFDESPCLIFVSEFLKGCNGDGLTMRAYGFFLMKPHGHPFESKTCCTVLRRHLYTFPPSKRLDRGNGASECRNSSMAASGFKPHEDDSPQMFVNKIWSMIVGPGSCHPHIESLGLPVWVHFRLTTFIWAKSPILMRKRIHIAFGHESYEQKRATPNDAPADKASAKYVWI